MSFMHQKSRKRCPSRAAKLFLTELVDSTFKLLPFDRMYYCFNYIRNAEKILH